MINPREDGAFIVIIGPDGTGKTTLARALVARFDGPTKYFHFRPPVLSEPQAQPPDSSPPGPEVKMPAAARRDQVVGTLRLLRSAIICTVGYWLRIKPHVRRGELVIGDRWIFGYLTQPRPLRFHGSPRFVRLLLRVMPAPTLTVSLTAPADVLLERKQELTSEQIADELLRAAELPIKPMITLSALAPPTELADSVLSHLRTQATTAAAPAGD